ncbi:MAG: phage Gp37/Gp68 family protein [Candidatus Thiodiazotropha endolucinida]
MAQNSKIEWTDTTWNPVTGCTKVSPGCKHCYADRMARRLKAMGQFRYRNGFEITLQDDLINLPLSWKKPRFVFVNSMSDLFHPDIPVEYIQKVFHVMEQANWHNFQLLTKRSDRLLEISHLLPWPDNVWIGVSVENADYINRINHLRSVPATVRFLSIEPLLGPLSRYPLKGIDWVIVGGESGPRARPMEKEWVRKIRDKCIALGVPFFFKQWGGARKSKTGRKLDGRTWDEMPVPKKRRTARRIAI